MFQVKNLLKYINSIPLPLTIRHYYPLDRELNSRESWDILRQSHPHFSISEDRAEWLGAAEGRVKKDGQDGSLIKRAADVALIIDQLGVTSVFSVGVGGAGLEYQIKKMRPNVEMICSEYSSLIVERLTKVFKEVDSIILFDMKKGDWLGALGGTPPDKHLCLMYRIDIDLTDSEFYDIFKKIYKAGIRNVLVITCGKLTFRGLFNRLSKRISWKIHNIPHAFAGYLRTIKTFTEFWKNLYTSKEFECGGLTSFLLKKID